MYRPLRAIEMTGTVDEHHQLKLDGDLPIAGPKRVRVIVLSPIADDEWDEGEWLKAAARNPAFDFLQDSAEDIYTLEDGRPILNQDSYRQTDSFCEDPAQNCLLPENSRGAEPAIRNQALIPDGCFLAPSYPTCDTANRRSVARRFVW